MVRRIEMVVLSVCLFVAAVASLVTADVEYESSIKDILARRRNLNYVKTLLQDLDSQLEKLQAAKIQKQSTGKRRVCIGGLGCDDSRVDGTGEHFNHHHGEKSPGRRELFAFAIGQAKRQYENGNAMARPRICIPGMGCDEGETIGTGEDFPDNNTPGRRELNVLGSGEDSKRFKNGNTPGRRGICIPGLGCGDGGVVGSGEDNNHHENGNTPGRRRICPVGLGCDDGGVIDTGKQKDHFEDPDGPGRRRLMKR